MTKGDKKLLNQSQHMCSLKNYLNFRQEIWSWRSIALLGQMADALVEGQRIEIRGFGSFDLHRRPPRIARNPKTGEAVNLPAKVAIQFKPGKELRDRVNAEHVQCGTAE